MTTVLITRDSVLRPDISHNLYGSLQPVLDVLDVEVKVANGMKPMLFVTINHREI